MTRTHLALPALFTLAAAGCTATSQGKALVPRPATAMQARVPLVAYVPFSDTRLAPEIAGAVGVQASAGPPGQHGDFVPLGTSVPLIKRRQLQEPAQITEIGGGEISAVVKLYAIDYDGLDYKSDYRARLEFPSGRRLEGRFARIDAIRDLSKSMDLAAINAHKQEVRIRMPGAPTEHILLQSNDYRTVEFSLHSRIAKIVFDGAYIGQGDKSVTLVVTGNHRERRWTWEFIE